MGYLLASMAVLLGLGLGPGAPVLANTTDVVPRAGNVIADPRTPYFTLTSTISVGNKGEELLDVSVEAVCGEPAWLFDHAELVVTRSRFGDVQFVGLPARGCTHCDPVALRWFHEPTGYLSFEVNVYRRLEVVSCPNAQSRQERG